MDHPSPPAREKTGYGLARMFHILLCSLRADCRRSAGRARGPAHPGYRQNRPQNAPQENGQDSQAFLSQLSFHSGARCMVSFRRGGFAQARISLEYRQHRNRQQKNDRGDGKAYANIGSDRTCLRRFSGGRCSSLRTRLRLGRLSPPSPDVSHSTLQPPCRLLITRGPNLQAGTSGLQAKPPPECSAGRPATL